jgi:hypothetical protein
MEGFARPDFGDETVDEIVIKSLSNPRRFVLTYARI